jgi:acyl-CoA dehydrogenase
VIMAARHPLLREEHVLLAATTRKFVERELLPHVEEWEEAEGFPDWVFRRMGELGLLGIRFPVEYGGQGADYMSATVLAETLAWAGSAAIGMAVGVQSEMATPPILKFGTGEQKRNCILPARRGEKIFSLCLTEPNAGSDLSSIETRARKEGDSWRLNGRKIFITNGVRADCYLVLARTGEERRGHRGMSLLLVEKGSSGFSVASKLRKLGMRGSDTAELAFEDCVVPAGNLVGEAGNGFYHIVWELQGERLWAAGSSVGRAQRCIEMATEYASQRVQFGKKLADMQVTRHKLADMATQLEAARQLTYYAAWRFDQGEVPLKEASMAKLFTAQMAFDVADEALQIFGGYGYMMESPIQRYWRDMRLARIGGGTDEIQKEIIAGEIIPRGS